MRVLQSQSLAWIAGHVAGPAAVASYEVEGLSIDPKVYDLIGGGVTGRPYMQPRRIVGLRNVLEFRVALRGGSLASTTVPVGALLRACGANESYSVATSATYKFSTAQGKTRFLADAIAGDVDPIDLKFNLDGLAVVTASECVGRVSIDLTPPNLGYFNFHFEGQHLDAYDSETAMDANATERQPMALEGSEDPRLTFNRTAYTGTATGATSATVLIASGATFKSNNVQPGNFITNTTTAATAVITSVDSETQVTTTTLSSGSWTATDAFSVRANTSYPDGSLTGKFIVHSTVLDAPSTIDARPGFDTNAYYPPRITDRGPAAFSIAIEEPLLSNRAAIAGFDWDRYCRLAAGDSTQFVTYTYSHNPNGVAGDKIKIQAYGHAAQRVRSPGPAGLARQSITFDPAKGVIITSDSVDLGGDGLTIQWT